MSVNSETQTSGRPRRSRVSRVRKAVLAIAFALFCAGVVVAGGLGDACSVGYEAIAAVCPLGALEGFFGSWSLFSSHGHWSWARACGGHRRGTRLLLLDMSRPPSSGILAHKEAAASRRGRAEGSGPRSRLRDGRRRARVAPAAAATFARVLETQEETRLSRRLHGPARA